MRPSRFLRDGLLVLWLAAPFAAPLAAQGPLPDLVVSSLTVTPASVAPGGSVEVACEIRNIGAGTVPLPATVPPTVSTWVEYLLVTSPTETPGQRLTGWGPLSAMPAGAAQHRTSSVAIPASKAPGSYFLCAEVDFFRGVTESNESNNRLCRPLTLAGADLRLPKGAGALPEGVRPGAAPPGAGALPDLTITGVTVGAVSGVSRAAQVTVKNVGSAPASNFRVDAFQLQPKRWPLLFTVCAQTSHAGGSASCASVWETGTLAAGASKTYSGYVTFPADHRAGTGERVEFMADGCFPALEPALPAGCRVAESNEGNNTANATVSVP